MQRFNLKTELVEVLWGTWVAGSWEAGSELSRLICSWSIYVNLCQSMSIDVNLI